MCWCYKWSDSSHQLNTPVLLPASVFIRKFETEIFLFMLRARTDQSREWTNTECLLSSGNWSTIIPPSLPSLWTKINPSSDKIWTGYIWNIVLVMWRAVATSGVTSPLLPGYLYSRRLACLGLGAVCQLAHDKCCHNESLLGINHGLIWFYILWMWWVQEGLCDMGHV